MKGGSAPRACGKCWGEGKRSRCKTVVREVRTREACDTGESHCSCYTSIFSRLPDGVSLAASDLELSSHLMIGPYLIVRRIRANPIQHRHAIKVLVQPTPMRCYERVAKRKPSVMDCRAPAWEGGHSQSVVAQKLTRPPRRGSAGSCLQPSPRSIEIAERRRSRCLMEQVQSCSP